VVQLGAGAGPGEDVAGGAAPPVEEGPLGVVDVGSVDVGLVVVAVVVVGGVLVGVVDVEVVVLVAGSEVVGFVEVVDVQPGAVLVVVVVVVPPGLEAVSVSPPDVLDGELSTVGSVWVSVGEAGVFWVSVGFLAEVVSLAGCWVVGAFAPGLAAVVEAAAFAAVLLLLAVLAAGLDATSFALAGVSRLTAAWRTIGFDGSAAPPVAATADDGGVGATGEWCCGPVCVTSTAAPVTSAAAARPAAALLASAPAPAEIRPPADPNAAPLLAVPATAAA
jgi:hypothetical protein